MNRRMKKIALKYEYVPTLDDIVTFIQRCKFDSDKVYCRIGEWVVLEGRFYADDNPYRSIERKASGLGIFPENPEFKKPSLIFDHLNQAVWILDPNFIDRISKALDEDIEAFRIDYYKAFYDIFDMDSFISSVKEGANNEID